jgi:hypothetical protein
MHNFPPRRNRRDFAHTPDTGKRLFPVEFQFLLVGRILCKIPSNPDGRPMAVRQGIWPRQRIAANLSGAVRHLSQPGGWQGKMPWAARPCCLVFARASDTVHRAAFKQKMVDRLTGEDALNPPRQRERPVRQRNLSRWLLEPRSPDAGGKHGRSMTVVGAGNPNLTNDETPHRLLDSPEGGRAARESRLAASVRIDSIEREYYRAEQQSSIRRCGLRGAPSRAGQTRSLGN